MITRNGVLHLLKYCPRLEPANYALNVHLGSVRRLSHELSVISQHETPSPPICSPVPLPAESPRTRATKNPLSMFLGRPTLIYSVQEFGFPSEHTYHQVRGGFSPTSLNALVSLLLIFCSEIGILVVGTRIRRWNEAAVFDTPHKVSGSCVGDGRLPNTTLARPLRICSVPEAVGMTL